MKRVFAMMLFLVIATGSYAGEKVKGELRTEINGFQWYCYKNKEAYSIDGKKLTHKGVKSVEFVVADKNDEGVFVFKTDEYIYIVKPSGDYIEYLYRYSEYKGKRKFNRYVSRIPIVFFNPQKIEYFTKVKDQYNGNYFLISKSGKRMLIYGKYTILDNFILTIHEGYLGSHVYLTNGKELGFFYLIEKIGSSNIYRVQDDAYSSYRYLKSNGEEIFKEQYDEIIACGERYLKVRNNVNYGIVNIDGKEIIPTSRGYTFISDYDSNKGTFAFTKKGFSGVCDAQGREISTTRLAPSADDIKANGGYTSAIAMNNGSTKYYKVSKGGRYGLTDSEGREIIPCEMEALESAGTGYLKYKLNGFWGVMNYTGKIIIDTDRGYTSIGDFKTFNKRFAYTMTGYKGECDASGRQISKIKVDTPQQTIVKQETQQDKKEKEKIIIIEPKPTPQPKPTLQPMTEWVPCSVCGHNPGVCQTCVGMGETASGRRCISCRGTGKCHFCNGQGGRYQTVYR
jgi:hypothetical protein